MEKIKFLTDSACDIPQELEQMYDIDIMPIPITIDAKSYYERVDFTNREFYDVLLKSSEIPVTSHITSPAFLEKYEQFYGEGYTDVVHVTICSKGSNMNSAAHIAKDMFFEEHPDAKGLYNIHIIDSMTYTMGYGYPIIESAKMASNGVGVAKILKYLDDFFNSLEIYFSVYSLDFAKKSGRVSCTAAFVGEVLGLRPIISIIDGEIKIIGKVRGDKNVVPKLAEIAAQRREKPNTPFMVAKALEEESAEELMQLARKKFKEEGNGVFEAGASITINAGPRLVGIMVLGENRKNK